jgi:predicted phage terminase large subunit-like protein
MNLPTLDEIDRELARKSLAEYIRQAWHVVEPSNKYIHGWHIDAISEHLEAATRGEIRNLIINIPPRHAKSLLCCVFWPTWVWATQPATRWLFSSYGENLAIRDSLKCRRVIQSPWYQRNFGDAFRLTGDQNQKTRFDNDKTGYRIATSVGGLGTGEGGDYIVVDDAQKQADAHSLLAREAVTDWWNNTMSTRGNNPDRVVKVVVMQRLHEQDLTGHLLERMQADGEHYEHLCLPARYEATSRVTSLGWHDPRTEKGQLLWPERFTPDALARLESSMDRYAVAGQLQQRPSPDAGGIFKKWHWRYWKPKGVKLPPVRVEIVDEETKAVTLTEVEAVDLPDSFDEVIQSWDMAFKDTSTSDFVAGQVWGKVGVSKYLLDYFNERADINATIRAVTDLTAKWPKSYAKLVEDKANGPAVIQLLRGKIDGLIAVNPEGGKIARAHAASPSVESHNVYLPHPALYGWVDKFKENCAIFPNGAHDDDVDAFTQTMIRWQVGTSAGTWGTRKNK